MTEIKMENGCRSDPLHLSPPSISLEMKTFGRCIVVCQLLSTTLSIYPLLCFLKIYFFQGFFFSLSEKVLLCKLRLCTIHIIWNSSQNKIKQDPFLI